MQGQGAAQRGRYPRGLSRPGHHGSTDLLLDRYSLTLQAYRWRTALQAFSASRPRSMQLNEEATRDFEWTWGTTGLGFMRIVRPHVPVRILGGVVLPEWERSWTSSSTAKSSTAWAATPWRMRNDEAQIEEDAAVPPACRGKQERGPGSVLSAGPPGYPIRPQGLLVWLNCNP